MLDDGKSWLSQPLNIKKKKKTFHVYQYLKEQRKMMEMFWKLQNHFHEEDL
jgi:hypothetical protein